MSVSLLNIIDFSTCPNIPTDLVPGRYYKLTGLNQGNLGDYSVYAIAIDNNVLSTSVQVLTSNGNTWLGTFDYTTCQLNSVVDNSGNNVNGITNIYNFAWYNEEVTNNYITNNSVVNMGDTWIDAFINNTINGTVDLSLISNKPGKSFKHNKWDNNSSTVIYDFQNTITFEHNLLDTGSELVITDAVDLEITATTIGNSSDINIDTTGTATITDSNVDVGSSVNFNGTANYHIDNSKLHRANLLSDTDTSGDFELLDSSVSAGNIDITNSVGNTLDTLFVENGTLTPNGHAAVNASLKGANSTLTGNASNAGKNGHSNPLP